MPKVAADTMLGIYGPFGLLSILGLLSMGVILCFSGMHWAAFSHLDRDQPARWAQRPLLQRRHLLQRQHHGDPAQRAR